LRDAEHGTRALVVENAYRQNRRVRCDRVSDSRDVRAVSRRFVRNAVLVVVEIVDLFGGIRVVVRRSGSARPPSPRSCWARW
jgi:hypothetical protein